MYAEPELMVFFPRELSMKSNTRTCSSWSTSFSREVDAAVLAAWKAE